MAPLQRAAAINGLGVVVARHERKGGGPVEEAGRGSSAFGGAADILLNLRRPEGNQRRTVRLLRGLSRFDSVPDELMIELTDAGYVAIGDKAALVAAETRAALLDRLPASADAGVTMDQAIELIDAPRTTIQRELAGLLAQGEVVRVGKGRSGDPFRYHRPAAADSLSAQPVEMSLGGQTVDGLNTNADVIGAPVRSRSAQDTTLVRAERLTGNRIDLVGAARTIFADDLAGAGL
jgi:hypothetical protein